MSHMNKDMVREQMDDYNTARWLRRYEQRHDVNWWGVTSLVIVGSCALFTGYLIAHVLWWILK